MNIRARLEAARDKASTVSFVAMDAAATAAVGLLVKYPLLIGYCTVRDLLGQYIPSVAEKIYWSSNRTYTSCVGDSEINATAGLCAVVGAAIGIGIWAVNSKSLTNENTQAASVPTPNSRG